MEELAGRQWWKELRAVMPVENGSVLYLKERQLFLEKCSPAMIVNQLAHQLGVDPRALRRRLRKLLGRRMVPLPLLPDLTLVPVRVRQGPGPMWGYLVYEQAILYRRIQEPPFRSAVYLDDGVVIPTLLTAGTLRRVWRETILAKREERRYYRVPQPPDPRVNERWPVAPHPWFLHHATRQEGPL